MTVKGVSVYLHYLCFNVVTGARITGDAANHTIEFLTDGNATPVTPANSPVEITNGYYTILATSTEMNVNTLTVSGTSTTTDAQIVGETIHPERNSYYVAQTSSDEIYEVTRGTTWSIMFTSLINDVDATRTALYCTVKQATLDDPLADVTDAEAIVQIEETDGLEVLLGAAQTTPNAYGALTVSAGLDTVTVTLAAAQSATVGPYERGGGLYLDIRQVLASGVVQDVARGRLRIRSEVTKAIA